MLFDNIDPFECKCQDNGLHSETYSDQSHTCLLPDSVFEISSIPDAQVTSFRTNKSSFMFARKLIHKMDLIIKLLNFNMIYFNYIRFIRQMRSY